MSTPAILSERRWVDPACKMGHMFWNWNTVGTCFISDKWRILSPSMFAGTCIFVALFTIAHHGFRFLGKWYDRRAMEALEDDHYRPYIWMQIVRAWIFTMQVVTAYFLMLLAMYFNGWYIISIFIGSFIGFFLFHWDFEHIEVTGAQKAWEGQRRCPGHV